MATNLKRGGANMVESFFERVVATSIGPSLRKWPPS